MSKKKKTIKELLKEAVVPEGEQPYGIPGNWVWARLGEVGELKGRIGWRGYTKSDLRESGPLVLGAAQISRNDEIDLRNPVHISIEKFVESPEIQVNTGDILIVKTGASIGKIAIVKEEIGNACINPNVALLKNIGINNSYLALYMKTRHFKNTLWDKVNSSAQPAINQASIKTVSIPIPPLAEQEQIADKVERLLSQIEDAKQLIEEAKETFEFRRAAILDQAFRGELTKKWRKANPNVVDAETLYSKIKENQVGKRKKTKDINDNEFRYGLPSTWKWVRLGDVFTMTSGGTPKRSEPDYYEGDIPWIKTGEVRWNYIYESEERITNEAIANSSAKLLPINTVLVAMYGQGLTRGRASILGIEAACNQAVCALLPNEYISPDFLFYYFVEGYQRFRQIAKGGNQENLSATVISDFLFPLPPLEEQKAIIDILGSISKREGEIKEIIDIQKNLDELKQSILFKAFRGELGTNDPNEESAIELLKEVLQKQV